MRKKKFQVHKGHKKLKKKIISKVQAMWKEWMKHISVGLLGSPSKVDTNRINKTKIKIKRLVKHLIILTV